MDLLNSGSGIALFAWEHQAAIYMNADSSTIGSLGEMNLDQFFQS